MLILNIVEDFFVIDRTLNIKIDLNTVIIGVQKKCLQITKKMSSNKGSVYVNVHWMQSSS